MSYGILSNSNPHDEAIRLKDGPQTRMKPGFVRDRFYRRSVRFRGKRISKSRISPCESPALFTLGRDSVEYKESFRNPMT